MSLEWVPIDALLSRQDEPAFAVWRLSELEPVADSERMGRKSWKLTDEQERRAVEMRDAGEASLREIGEMFGVSYEAIRIMKVPS